MAHRFTIDGSDSLESFLSDHCAQIAQEVVNLVPPHLLQALILGGGYGRGEGGVLRTPEGDQPYNDLEFFLLVRGVPRINEKRFGKGIHDLERKMTLKMGIDVEFKISSLGHIAEGKTTMFAYDLVQGHRVLVGPESILESCGHHADAARIPLHEVTRLMMNRCSGLLFAKSRLMQEDFSQEDANFVLRNIRKAQLAMGDAILAMEGRYHWSCLQRRERLLQVHPCFDAWEEIQMQHSQGVNFKLHPRQAAESREILAGEHEKVVSLAWSVFALVEMKRLRQNFSHPSIYFNSRDKCPETWFGKNALIRLRAFGWAGIRHGLLFRYPREALLHALVMLLWQNDAIDFSYLSKQLVCEVSDWPQAVAAYQNLWNRYN